MALSPRSSDLRLFVEERAKLYSAPGPLRTQIIEAANAAAATELDLADGVPVERAMCRVVHKIARLEIEAAMLHSSAEPAKLSVDSD